MIKLIVSNDYDVNCNLNTVSNTENIQVNVLSTASLVFL